LTSIIYGKEELILIKYCKRNTDLKKNKFMTEIPLEYWNKLASQLIMISSLLSGFSIAVTANLLVNEANNRITNYILKTTTIASGCFLVTVFAMTKILMMTTQGYPYKIAESDLNLPKMIGIAAILFGIISLSIVIALSGWTKSKRIGIFTTIVGILTFLMILMTLIEIRT
jgi:cytochrome bd-type quinol oxidase subunit 2